MTRRICITGGIGAGKSVVCHALTALGWPVYDCDSEARRLMESDSDMKQRIAEEVTPDALNADGTLCRKAIADAAFANPEKLAALNSIVHGAVRRHFLAWASRQKSKFIFVETAIAYESGFNSLVDEIWEVTAPVSLRIRRVETRSKLSPTEIRQRIAAQQSAPRPNHRIIINDDLTPIIPQINKLLK